MKLKDAKKKEGIKEACTPHENKRAHIVIFRYGPAQKC